MMYILSFSNTFCTLTINLLNVTLDYSVDPSNGKFYASLIFPGQGWGSEGKDYTGEKVYATTPAPNPHSIIVESDCP